MTKSEGPAVDQFLSYVSRFDPTFLGRIRGAEPAQMAALGRLAGLPLPASYAHFLARMGRDNGGINPTVDGTTDVAELIAYYETEVRGGATAVPAGCVLIGVGAVSLPDVALDCNEEGEPPVVFTDGDEVAGRYADSLEKLLFQIAFGKYRLRTFPWRTFLANSFAGLGRKMVVEEAAALAQAAGFDSCPFSDATTFCGEKADAAVKMTQYEGQGIGISLAARGEHLVAALRADLMARFGVMAAS